MFQILIHSAAGGVGLAAVQLARYAGLEVIATVGSDAKIDLLKKEWGVTHAINYQKEDFHVAVEKLYGTKKCMDIVLDPAGITSPPSPNLLLLLIIPLLSAGGPQLKTEQQLLRSGGRVVSFGVATISDRSLWTMWTVLRTVASMMTFSVIDLLRSSTG